ncbi:hypothetical protein HDE_03293 [Halotydeus destructor]|nr:hypothetical protein HDE_03293 [Halotydeus destructor]
MKPSLASTVSLLPIFLVVVLLHVPSSSGARRKDVARMANSPIYYISMPAFGPGSAPASGGFHSLFLTALKKHSQLRKSPSVAPRPSLSSAVSSNMYRLPIKYTSNAKPVEIKKIVSETASAFVRKNKKPYKSVNSRIIYLPINFMSNAKPTKVMINALKSS